MPIQRPSDVSTSDYPQPEAEKRRDDLLRTLLKTPPTQRPKREREAKPKQTGAKGAKPKKG